MNISLILPAEILEIILDCLDSRGLLNFQHTCHAWREIVLNYIINGRLKNRSFISGPFVSFKQHKYIKSRLCAIISERSLNSNHHMGRVIFWQKVGRYLNCSWHQKNETTNSRNSKCCKMSLKAFRMKKQGLFFFLNNE